MKSLFKLPALALGLLLLVTTSQVAKAQYDDVSLQTFYDELSPYGTWINDPEYGYVWRPDVDQSDFRPYYSNGRWAMTEYGNTWVSNYDWGWAPFHYGRWTYNRYNNWVWIPDTVWGPAWVNWRSGGGYYGWAPMTPSVGVHVNLGIADFYWNFIPYGNIYVNSFPRYYSGRNRVYVQNTVIINNTYVRNNRTYYTGPRVDDIRRHTNQRVTVYNIERTSRNGGNRIGNNRVSIYSPRPTRDRNDNGVAAPRQAVQANINRDRVERNGNVVTRDRNNNSSNNARVEHSDNASNNRNNDFSRGREGVVRDNGRNNVGTPNNRANGVDAKSNDNNNNRNVFGRSRDRSETTVPSNNTNPQKEMSKPRENNSQRNERSGVFGSRSSSSEGRATQTAPQRSAERPQVQRAERPQQSSQSSSSRGSSNSSRNSNRGESSGRPGRG